MSTPPRMQISVECLQGTWTHDAASQQCRFTGVIKIRGQHLSCRGAPLFSFSSYADLDVPVPDFYRFVMPVPVVDLSSSSSSSTSHSPLLDGGAGTSTVAPPSASAPKDVVEPTAVVTSASSSLPSWYLEPIPLWGMPTYADGMDTDGEIPTFSPPESLPPVGPPGLSIPSNEDPEDDPDYQSSSSPAV